MQLASGIPVNLRSNLELNNDGTASDRPNGVPRNSLTLPSRKNVDFRYSRKIRIRGNMAAEVIGEVKNIFNTEQVSSVNATVHDQRAGRADRRAADVGRAAARRPAGTSSGSSSWGSSSLSRLRRPRRSRR